MSAPRTPGMGDGLANLAIGALIGLAALAGVLRLAGTIAAFLSGSPPPRAGVAAGLMVLAQPGNPGAVLDAERLSAVAYWLTTTLLLAGLGVLAWWVWGKARDHARRVEVDPRRLTGTATRAEIAHAASGRALLKRASTLRPSLDAPRVSDVGYLLGRSRGTSVWASVEDSILLVGPPRSGKGMHVVINAILDAPGAVVTTSTRPDNLTATLKARQHGDRPVAVFDPQDLAEGLPAGLRWSPVRGCEDPLTAMIRATGLASGTGLSAGGVEGGGFWEGKTRAALQALLHAAALDARPPSELSGGRSTPPPQPRRSRSCRTPHWPQRGGQSRWRR